MPVPLAKNKKALFDYEILETFEAGLVLAGWEVKAVRSGRVELRGAFAQIRGGEGWLKNALIGPWGTRKEKDDAVLRQDRKLLLHAREIKRLMGKLEEKGLTLVPIDIYESRGHFKVSLGLGRGKRQYEKRDSIKKREVDRLIRRHVNV